MILRFELLILDKLYRERKRKIDREVRLIGELDLLFWPPPFSVSDYNCYGIYFVYECFYVFMTYDSVKRLPNFVKYRLDRGMHRCYRVVTICIKI